LVVEWYGSVWLLETVNGFEIEVNMVCDEGLKLLVMEILWRLWWLEVDCGGGKLLGWLKVGEELVRGGFWWGKS
jgi:hypothetical protein